MMRLAAAILCLPAVLLPPAAAAPPPAPAGAPVAAVPGEARQLLVMLRLPPRHYRPDAGYGGSYLNDAGRAARRRTALAITQEYGLKLVSDWPMPIIGVDCFVMEARDGMAFDALLDALGRDPRVEWAQAVQEFEGLSGPDPLLPLQPAARHWQLADLHRIGTGGGVRVAVIDSAVDAAHPDLQGQVGIARNFVDGAAVAAERHGTAVAGIIGAREGNGAGIAGIAPGASLMALRACREAEGQRARCTSLSLGKAINFAMMNEARVINLSLGGPPDRLLAALLDAAQARGVLVVGAIDPARPDGGFPASHPGVLAVAGDAASAGALRHRALLAPASDIPTSVPGGRWGFVSGSSYAAAHVSGLLALVAGVAPAARPALLRQVLGDIPGMDAACCTGTDTANMGTCAILARLAGACACPCPPRPAAIPPRLR